VLPIDGVLFRFKECRTSAFGTKRHLAAPQQSVAFGGKADMGFHTGNVGF